MFLVAAKARSALLPLFKRGALVSVDAQCAVCLPGDILVPHQPP
jgi:hypothetical protein